MLLKDYQAYLRVEKGLTAADLRGLSDGDLKTFAEFIEGRNGVLLMAVQEDVAAFLEHLRAHGIDSRSSARKLSCLRGFYKWLLLDRRIHHDPTVNIESPKAWKVLPKSLAEPEVAEMLERAAMAARIRRPGDGAAGPRDSGAALCGRAARLGGDGAVDRRPGAGLGRVQVRGKGDKERIVPLGRSALQALEKYLREGRPHLARISSARKASAAAQDAAGCARGCFSRCAACR